MAVLHHEHIEQHCQTETHNGELLYLSEALQKKEISELREESRVLASYENITIKIPLLSSKGEKAVFRCRRDVQWNLMVCIILGLKRTSYLKSDVCSNFGLSQKNHSLHLNQINRKSASLQYDVQSPWLGISRFGGSSQNSAIDLASDYTEFLIFAL